MDKESLEKLIKALEGILPNLHKELEITEGCGAQKCKVVHYKEQRSSIVVKLLIYDIKQILSFEEEDYFMTVPDIHPASKSNEDVMEEFRKWLEEILKKAKKLADNL